MIFTGPDASYNNLQSLLYMLHVPENQKIPYGESSMWGDYHMRELVLMITRLAEDKGYYTFFEAVKK